MGQRGDLQGELWWEEEMDSRGLRGDLRVVAAWAICEGALAGGREGQPGLRGDLCVGLRGRFARGSFGGRKRGTAGAAG